MKALSAFADRVRGSTLKSKGRVVSEVQEHNAKEHSPAQVRARDVADITAQLRLMFPQLSQSAITGVLSELLKMYPNCSRNQLSDLAMSSLLEVRLMRDQPRHASLPGMEEDLVPGMVHDSSKDLRAFPTPRKQTSSIMIELDSCLANMFLVPDYARGCCLHELRRILEQVSSEPQGLLAGHSAEYFSKPEFEKVVGRYPPAIALLCLAGFKEEFGNDGGKTFTFVGDPRSESFSAVLSTLQRLTAEESLSPVDLEETDQATVQDLDEIVDCGSPIAAQVEHRGETVALSRKPSRLTALPPISDYSSAKKGSKTGMSKSKSTITAQDGMETSPPARSTTKSLAANWGFTRPGPGNCITNQSARPQEQRKTPTDFEVLMQKALDGTNLHRAQKGLAPLTSLRCPAEGPSLTNAAAVPDDTWTGDVVTIPDDDLTNPNFADDESVPRPKVAKGTWTAEPESEKKVLKGSHGVPSIFSGKGKLRVAKARREKQTARRD